MLGVISPAALHIQPDGVHSWCLNVLAWWQHQDIHTPCRDALALVEREGVRTMLGCLHVVECHITSSVTGIHPCALWASGYAIDFMMRLRS